MVSVIIPVYNAALWLEKTVKSALQQNFLKEIILVDDHSTDNSLLIAKQLQKKYPDKIKLFINPKKGSNYARNYGFLKSSGKYIQWLDADDLLLPGKFNAQINTLTKTKADITYSDWYMDFYEKQKFIKREKRQKAPYNDYLYELLKDNWSPPANYLLTRKIAQKLFDLGYWNPETPVAQDREYFTVAAIEGAKFVYTPGFYSIYNRWSQQQISAIDFKKRLEFQVHLEKKFRDLIASKNFPYRIKLKYFACLNAHILNACFYNPKVKITYPFNILNVNWKLIHWKKYPFIPLLYFWKHAQYLMDKLLSPKSAL